MVLQQDPAQVVFSGIVVSSLTSSAPMVHVQLKKVVKGPDMLMRKAEVRATKGRHTSNSTEWLWIVRFPPVVASPSDTFTATAATSEASAHLTHLVFGDVWICAGQSNMMLPLQTTYGHNKTLSRALSGEYANLRTMRRSGAGNGRWLPARAGAADGSLSEFCGTCWYFGEALTDRFAREGHVVPNVGLVCVAEGASEIERWAPQGVLHRDCSHTFEAATDGDLFRSRLAPLVSIPIRGWLWQQGEHNVRTNAISGHSTGGYGYGCELPAMLRAWRSAWSVMPNTTEPLAPFGVTTLHPRAGWQGAVDFGGMRWSQTANYGRLPSPAMPRTFLAQAYDLLDPFMVRPDCYYAKCCGPMHGCHHDKCSLGGRYDASACAKFTTPLGGPAACAPFCRELGETPAYVVGLGALHSRLKRPIGRAYGSNPNEASTQPATMPAAVGAIQSHSLRAVHPARRASGDGGGTLRLWVGQLLSRGPDPLWMRHPRADALARLQRIPSRHRARRAPPTPA